MDIEEQFELDYVFLTERKCRTCGELKDLVDGFYLTRKGRGKIPSAYAYECKFCTINRITNNRKNKLNIKSNFEYPDW